VQLRLVFSKKCNATGDEFQIKYTMMMHIMWNQIFWITTSVYYFISILL